MNYAQPAEVVRQFQDLLRRARSSDPHVRSRAMRNAKRIALHYGLQLSRGANNQRRRWTPAEDAQLRQHFPHERSEVVAARIGRPVAAIRTRAATLGLRKSAEFLASPASGVWRKGRRSSPATEFKPGQAPVNKGLRRPGWSRGRMRETQFKKGQKPQTWQPIGHERLQDGYLQRKVTDTGYTPRDYRPVHHLVWEAHTGRPVPKGYALAFVNRDRSDIRFENLELVSRSELMLRNSVHRFPRELVKAVQLKGALKRQINKRMKGL